jgi:DNA-binding transcriptional ArsR family regulator
VLIAECGSADAAASGQEGDVEIGWHNRTIVWYNRTMNALADILSSRVKAEVFRLLFGLDGRPLHLREIERQSGLAVSTVRQELQQLTSLGLVEKRVDGNRRLYSANRHHPLYPDIRNIVLKTSGLAEILRAALQPETSIRLAFVFGSLARGEEQAGSDLDLMVIGSLTLRQLTRRLSGVGGKIVREINPHVLTLEEFLRRRQDGDHFLSTVLAAKRIFIIGNDHELETVG